MKHTTNNDKMLQAVLLDKKLMELGGYQEKDVVPFYEALNSENVVISSVAKILSLHQDGSNNNEIYRFIKDYLMNSL